MPSLINALKSLLGLSAQLSRLEKTIFDAAGQKLEKKEAQLWNGQLAAINKIHRSPDGKEVNVWAMRGGKPDFPKELCFGKSEEFKLAVVDVMASAGALTLRGRVWCVGGHVFSIEYKNSFKEFEKSAQGDWQVHCHIENYPT